MIIISGVDEELKELVNIEYHIWKVILLVSNQQGCVFIELTSPFSAQIH